MTRLTVEEFAEQFPEQARWPLSIAARAGEVAAFMIEFSQPHFLAGPFGGSYGLVTISDCRISRRELVTETEAYNNWRTTRSLSQYHWPRHLTIGAGLSTVHEYIMGRHRNGSLEPVPEQDSNDTRFFMTRNTLGGSATLQHPFLAASEGTSFDMDGLDMLKLFRHMASTMDRDAILATIDRVEEAIEDDSRKYLENIASSEPTIENPFLLRLQGNDDSSWGRTFPDLESALAFADELEEKASYRFVTGNLDPTN